METAERASRPVWLHVIIGSAIAATLYAAGLSNYLLFHSLAEVFSIVIAGGVFMIAWNSRALGGSRLLAILGIGYLFVGVVDLLHTLSYQGMGVFQDARDYPTQLWIAGRTLQALTVALFAVSVRFRRRVSVASMAILCSVVTALVLAAIFWWECFPLCFVEGVGVTVFKRISEYVISLILLGSLILLVRPAPELERSVRRLMIASVGLTILSELSFTFYISAFGLSNLVGHLLKIVAFYLTYRALIADEVRRRMRDIDSLRRAGRALAQSESELRQSNDAKDRLLSILAHDLRNPFSSVISAVEILSDSYDSLEDTERKAILEAMKDSAGQGMGLLEDLLTWAHAQTRRLTAIPTRVNVRDLVQKALRYVASRAQAKRLAVDCRVGAAVLAHADSDMIATVLRNLLSNAVKFTPPNGTIVVNAESEHDHLKVSVSDSGVGMGQETISDLFRIDRITTRPGTNGESGSGLGLLVCKEFVDGNHGRLWVSSEPGGGSTFTFTVPRHRIDHPPA